MPTGYLSRKVPDVAHILIGAALSGWLIYQLRTVPEQAIRKRCEAAKTMGPFPAVVNYHLVRSLFVPFILACVFGTVFLATRWSRSLEHGLEVVSRVAYAAEWLAAVLMITVLPLYISLVLFNRPRWAAYRGFRGESGLLRELRQNQ